MWTDFVRSAAKSLVAAAATGVAAAIPLATDAGGFGGYDWLVVLGAVLTSQQAVYWTSNTDPKGKRQAESVQPPERPVRPEFPGGEYR